MACAVYGSNLLHTAPCSSPISTKPPGSASSRGPAWQLIQSVHTCVGGERGPVLKDSWMCEGVKGNGDWCGALQPGNWWERVQRWAVICRSISLAVCVRGCNRQLNVPVKPEGTTQLHSTGRSTFLLCWCHSNLRNRSISSGTSLLYSVMPDFVPYWQKCHVPHVCWHVSIEQW